MLRRWLVNLYPASWRARYGDEFSALLDEQPVTPSTVIDIMRGALGARASAAALAPTDGDLAMRTRTLALASVVAALLVLPAVTFLSAALVRSLQPVEYQPARAAQAVFDWFAALPSPAVGLLLWLAPAAALVVAVTAAGRRLRTDASARADLVAFLEGWRRILHQPALVLAALALVASAGVLGFAIVHSIAG